MKKIFLLLALCSATVFAQKKTYSHSLQGIKKVQIQSASTVNLISGNTNQLEISGVKNENDDKRLQEKKKGLKAVYSIGVDNTNGFGFTITKEGNLLIIKDLKSHFQRGRITITLPKTMNVDINSGSLGSIKVDGFTSEIEVRTTTGSINLKNVTGPITAHTSTGVINVTFTTVSQSSPISITSSTGEIDVALPRNTKANLNVSSRGTIYTNFDFKAPDKKGLPNISGLKKISSPLNGGGVTIKLKSSMGRIYLRKK
tara:strand:- start:51260 stop:52030 length:771 start_codon:yes stop_codon:yes gene_type:complete